MKRTHTFHRRRLYRSKEIAFPALQYLKDTSAFWIAAFSVIAFLAGNIIGEHGWYAFKKSVFGAVDETAIVYEGAVAPIEKVPDYRKWSAYGGNAEEHTFRQVPSDLLIPLPAYDANDLEDADTLAAMVYSVGFMGSYSTGHEGDGSHIGTDIRVPTGTPVLSIMNGIVTSVREDVGGFGKLVVIKHPNVPDPASPSTLTTLYSSYAHLSSQEVTEGQLVEKGQIIGLSGKTGFATGPHLHFQLDREASWHPYWPFTSGELREAGLSTTQAINTGFHQERGYLYSVNPMTYVQANHSAVARASSTSSAVVAVSSRETKTAAQLREERLQRRLSRRLFSERIAQTSSPAAASSSSVTIIVGRETVATTSPEPIHVTHSSSIASSAPASASSAAVTAATPVGDLEFVHDGVYGGREWEILRIMLLDSAGNRIEGPAVLEDPIHLMPAYGEVEFEKNDLTAADFEDGAAIVKILPRGERTVVIKSAYFPSQSEPMRYVK